MKVLGPRLVREIDRWQWGLLALLVVVGAALRLPEVGVYWVNPDEGNYYAAATASWGQASGIVATNTTPPLHYLLLRGIASAGGGIDAMRALSFVAGVALLPLLFLIGRAWAGATAGLVAVLLILNGPGSVVLSNVMRPYMLQSACLALGLWALFRHLENGRAGYAVLLTLAWTAALLLHYGSYLFLGAALGYCALLFARGELDRRRAVALTSSMAILTGVGAILYATHVVALQEGAMHEWPRTPWLAKYLASSPGELLHNYRSFPKYPFGRPARLFVPWLLPLAMILPAAVRFRPALFAGAALGAALLASSLGLYPFGSTRHATHLAVAVAPAVGVAVEGLLGSRRLLVSLAGIACLALIVWNAFQPGSVGTASVERTATRAVVESVAGQLVEATRPGDLVLSDGQTFGVLGPILGRFEAPRPVAVADGTRLMGFQAGGLNWVLYESWRMSASAHSDGLAAALRALTGSGREWDTAGRGVWLVQGGFDEPIANGLPERLPDDTPLRGPLVGGVGLVLTRLYPAAYLSHAEGRAAE
jgi:hypothetical protein